MSPLETMAGNPAGAGGTALLIALILLWIVACTLVMALDDAEALWITLVGSALASVFVALALYGVFVGGVFA